MNKILVTGSEGFFASRFIEYYKDEYDITALNHSTLDISDEKETIKTIKQIGPDYIVHAAAISDTGACEKNPELSYKVNVVGTANIAKGCAEAGAKLFVLSSDQVYNGNLEAGPYSEEYVVPNTVYGNHKLEAEKAAAKIVKEAVSLRLTWMFSLPERHKKINSNIVWNVTKAAMKKEPLKLPVNEFRGITYVYDLIENFSKMLSLPAGVYNAGSENNLSTYETAKIVLEKLGLSEGVNELLIRDEERFRYNRDLRITNKKLQDYNIYFSNTEEAVHKCMKDFLYKI